MQSWSSFVRSTIKELRSGSEVPDYFGNLIPLVSRNKKKDNLGDYKEEDDLISIDAVQIQNSRQKNRQQPVNNNNMFFQNNNNRVGNDFNDNNYNYSNKFGNQQVNSNYYDIYPNNQNEAYEDHSYLPQPENIQRFNNNRNSNINNNVTQDNYRQKQQKPMPYYEEDENIIDDYKNDIVQQNNAQNMNSANEVKDDLIDPDFEPSRQVQKQKQQQISQSPIRQEPQSKKQQQDLSDSFNESPNKNLIHQQNAHDTQSTPEVTKQSKEKVYIPETPEMVDYPSSASDVPWQDVPKSSQQPFPSESLINAIDQIGVYEDKQQQNQQSAQKKQQLQQNQQRQIPQQQQQVQQEEQSFNDYSHDQQHQEQSFNDYSHDQPQQEQSFNEYSQNQQQESRFENDENELDQEQADDDDNNNSIDEEINVNERIDNDNEEENSDMAPVPFGERFRILSGGIIDRYWSHVDTEVPRIIPESKILTSFKASKFIKYKNAMDSFAKKVEGKKHHLRFKQVDQA